LLAIDRSGPRHHRSAGHSASRYTVHRRTPTGSGSAFEV
jgi:hypothetical protein